MRRKKPREVVSLPENLGFRPINDPEGKRTVVLTVDEYESIRLVDKEGVSQAECGAYMNVSRNQRHDLRLIRPCIILKSYLFGTVLQEI